MYLDFAADDAGHGGYVLLDRSTFAAGVVGLGDYPLVSLRDGEVPRRGSSLDVRTEGLWASITCETPGMHWSAGMEAFAVGYDDAVDAIGAEIGDRVPLGFDLEWERDGDIWRVHGEVLVGDERVDIDTGGCLSEDERPLVSGRVGDASFATSDLIPVVAPDGLLATGVASAGDKRVELEPRWHAPIKGESIPRALCRLSGDGVAWVG